MPVSSTVISYDLLSSFRYDPKLLTSPWNTQVNGIELPYLLFAFHLDRLVAAAQHFGWHRALAVLRAPGAAQRIRHMCDAAVMECPIGDKEKGLGLRLLLSPSGEVRIEAHPTRPLTHDPLRASTLNPLLTPPSLLPQPIFTVHLDTRPTPISAFTAFKTTHRAHYDAARARRGIRDRREAREVLLWNERGEVMEGSVRNVAFWRGGGGGGVTGSASGSSEGSEESEAGGGGGGGGWVTPPDRSGGLPGTVRRYLLERGLVREGVIHVQDVRVGEIVLLCNGWDGTLFGRIVGD